MFRNFISRSSFCGLFGKTGEIIKLEMQLQKVNTLYLSLVTVFLDFIPSQIDALLIMYLFHYWLHLLSHLVRATWGPRMLIEWIPAGDLWSQWSGVHSSSLTNDSDRGPEHSVNVSDFGGNKFMRINDLNSDWGLWFGLCTALLLINALW